MGKKLHRYGLRVVWTGDRGTGTSGYRDYERAHELLAEGKPPLLGSADSAFRGDPARWNPEELLLASLAACHQLWYLHLCAVAGVVVVGYEDRAEGEMEEEQDGGGQFRRVVLRPKVLLAAGSNVETAVGLHKKAHSLCFIARSVNFPIVHEPEIMPLPDP